MFGRRSLLSTCLTLSVLLSVGLSSAETYEETQDYTGGPGDDRVLCGPNIGGACFDFGAEVRLVDASIKLDDDSGLSIGGYWTFRDAADENLKSSQFCDSAQDLEIPAAATRLIVFIDGPVFGPQDCLLSHGSPGIGTTGRITVTIEYEEF